METPLAFAFGITLGLLFIGIVFYFIVVYNILVRLRNNLKKSWANIDVLLKQRNDELPKLIDSVKGYMTYEKNVLKDLTHARTDFLNAKDLSIARHCRLVIPGIFASFSRLLHASSAGTRL